MRFLLLLLLLPLLLLLLLLLAAGCWPGAGVAWTSMVVHSDGWFRTVFVR